MLFVTKKVINGETYHYLQYGGNGLYLGKTLPENLKEQMVKFFKTIGEESGDKLNTATVKAFAPKRADVLEQKKYLFTLISSSELFTKEYAQFLKKFIISFAFNSNRSEGSRTKRDEFERIAMSNIRVPKTRTEKEVLNSLAAVKFAFSDKMKWNPKCIRKLHGLLLNGMDSPVVIGAWKTESNVAPGNQPTTHPSEVKDEIKKLLAWFKKNKRRTYAPLLAIEFYIRFEGIHPFLDGNGRVGRVLLNAILFHQNYVPIVFFSQNHTAHCRAITKALNGRPGNFRLHFIDQAKKTFDLVNEII